MEKVKELIGMSYEEFKKETIESFKKYIEDEEIRKTEITEDTIYNYFSCMHFDFMSEVESIEDLQYIEKIMENILKDYYIKVENKMNNKKVVTKILLSDNANDNELDFCDLIKFKEEYYLEDIEKAINDFKEKDYEENGFYTYSNEDIYNELSEKFEIETIEFLSDIDILEY